MPTGTSSYDNLGYDGVLVVTTPNDPPWVAAFRDRMIELGMPTSRVAHARIDDSATIDQTLVELSQLDTPPNLTFTRSQRGLLLITAAIPRQTPWRLRHGAHEYTLAIPAGYTRPLDIVVPDNGQRGLESSVRAMRMKLDPRIPNRVIASMPITVHPPFIHQALHRNLRDSSGLEVDATDVGLVGVPPNGSPSVLGIVDDATNDVIGQFVLYPGAGGDKYRDFESGYEYWVTDSALPASFQLTWGQGITNPEVLPTMGVRGLEAGITQSSESPNGGHWWAIRHDNQGPVIGYLWLDHNNASLSEMRWFAPPGLTNDRLSTTGGFLFTSEATAPDVSALLMHKQTLSSVP